MRTLWLLAAFALSSQTSPAQPLTTLHAFGGPDGQAPYAHLALSGNTLYGTTTMRYAPNSQGIVFKVNTDGSGYTVIYAPAGTDWQNPQDVIVDGDTLYGTTEAGSQGSPTGGKGTIFRMRTDGSNYTVLKFFNGPDGRYPNAGLVLNGETLFGTTTGGGDWDAGTVFRINSDGSNFAVLYSFAGTSTTNLSGEPIATTNLSGASPVTEVTPDGATLYGTTSDGGEGHMGTLFRIDTNGNGFAVLHTFSALTPNTNTNADGGYPKSALILSGDTLYGTGASGGAAGWGTVFSVKTNGTDFTVLHHFPGPPSSTRGLGPWAGLVIKGSTIYGATGNGQNSVGGEGTIFKLGTDGSNFTTLYNFSAYAYDPGTMNYTNSDGTAPCATLTMDGDTLYGTSVFSGPQGWGTLFSLKLPAQPQAPVVSCSMSSTGAFVLSWTSEPGRSYQVQYNQNPNTMAWSNLTDMLVASNNTLSFYDPSRFEAQRFYRVVMAGP